MTPRELVLDIRKQLGKPKREPTDTELALAGIALVGLNACSTGYIRAIPPKVSELKLDTRAVDEGGL